MCFRNIHFLSRSALCGYNLTLQYPQPEHFPTLEAPISSTATLGNSARSIKKRGLLEAQKSVDTALRGRKNHERLRARDVWKRGLAGRANGTIDPWYQCDLHTEMLDYALNFTFPWCTCPSAPIPLTTQLAFQHRESSSTSTISPMR